MAATAGRGIPSAQIRKLSCLRGSALRRPPIFPSMPQQSPRARPNTQPSKAPPGKPLMAPGPTQPPVRQAAGKPECHTRDEATTKSSQGTASPGSAASSPNPGFRV